MLAQKLISLILPSLLFLPLLGHSQITSKLDNNTDQFALLAFKSYITIDPFGVLESWNSSTTLCNWKGVSCNITKQRVRGLNLENSGLVGTIAPQISNLSFLSYLNLQNNTFQGNLPQELGKLFRLKFFLLGSNQLLGTIPTSLSLCPKLLYIDLSRNKLEGTIPPELSSLSKLQAISLMDNFLTGEIPSSFRNLSSLTNLVLLSNSLQGPIPDALGHLPFLLNLQIGLNNFVGEIPSSVFNCSSLIILGLAGNKLSGTLPSNLFSKLANLTTLYLGGNQLSGPIPISLANASQLVRVDFSSNNFAGLIPLLGNLPSLQILNLEINSFVSDGENGFGFITPLANSTQLKVFSLATNHLTGKLPSSIGNLSRQLSLLLFDENYLEGYVPGEISNLVGLTMLSLEFNSFSGNIPSSLGTLPNLQNLYLHRNRFSGPIPVSLGNLTELSEMSLKNNLLTGTIPVSLGNYQHLQVLDLSANKLSGTMPREIFGMPSFAKLLNLSWNSLSGPLPEEIGNLKMIQAIDVSGNQLTGNIPVSTGDCSSLFYLNLSRNSFQGPIPNSLSSMKGIVYIDLSSNNLFGQIPISLEALRFLQVLDLSKNQLQGEVPKEGIFKNVTAVSLEGNPQLCGGISKFNLPNCPVTVAKKHSRVSKVKLIVPLVVGFVAILTLCLVLVLSIRKKKLNNPTIDDDDGPIGIHHKLYKRDELRIATRNFSPENLIGEGSFGTVYKGVFGNGTVAAIKVFKMEIHKAPKSFLAECEALRHVRHRNLVKIISVCSRDDFKALVLQFMPNGSLEQWLHERNIELPEEEMRPLDIKQRLEIAQDIASAIEYLHHDCETPVVHCDLKPSNVLLDENMCAHVADFGLARLLLSGPNMDPVSSTIGRKGSIGYISPEYGIGGGVSTKGDVYSFGILMLELFTNKKPTDEMFSGDLDLQRWVSMGLGHRVMDIVDQRLLEKERNSISPECIVGVLEIGLMCAAKSPEVRPSMREVSMMIKHARAKLLN